MINWGYIHIQTQSIRSGVISATNVQYFETGWLPFKNNDTLSFRTKTTSTSSNPTLYVLLIDTSLSIVDTFLTYNYSNTQVTTQQVRFGNRSGFQKIRFVWVGSASGTSRGYLDNITSTLDTTATGKSSLLSNISVRFELQSIEPLEGREETLSFNFRNDGPDCCNAYFKLVLPSDNIKVSLTVTTNKPPVVNTDTVDLKHAISNVTYFLTNSKGETIEVKLDSWDSGDETKKSSDATKIYSLVDSAVRAETKDSTFKTVGCAIKAGKDMVVRGSQPSGTDLKQNTNDIVYDYNPNTGKLKLVEGYSGIVYNKLNSHLVGEASGININTIPVITEKNAIVISNNDTANVFFDTASNILVINNFCPGDVYDVELITIFETSDSVTVGVELDSLSTVPSNPQTTFQTKNFFIQPLNPLPVSLASFEVNKIDENVFIQWSTASEVNNREFIVEESLDGIVFNEIYRTPGAGNSNEMLTYSTIHSIAGAANGFRYYRLTQVDFDNNFEIFPVRTIRINNANATESFKVELYPNPANTSINIDLSSNNNTLYVIDNQGKVVLNQMINSNENIDVSSFKKGIYIFRIVTNTNEIITHKVIVQ